MPSFVINNTSEYKIFLDCVRVNYDYLLVIIIIIIADFVGIKEMEKKSRRKLLTNNFLLSVHVWMMINNIS